MDNRLRVDLSFLPSDAGEDKSAKVLYSLRKPLKRKGEGKLTGFLGRWAGLGPYYAMFPMEFARTTIQRTVRVADECWIRLPVEVRASTPRRPPAVLALV